MAQQVTPVPPFAATASRAERMPAGLWVVTTYFAEGLPFSVVHQMAAQLFTACNASLEAIGLTSLYGLAWNLKFLWSPLMDLWGTPKRWLVGLQLAVGLSIGLLAWPAQHSMLSLVAKILVLVSVLAASQDIAIDGFYLRALSDKGQAAHAGTRVGAYRLALLAGNGGLIWVAGKVNWGVCFAAGGAMLLGLGLLHSLLLPSPPRSVQATKSEASPGASSGSSPTLRFLEPFLSFFRHPQALWAVVFIVFYRAGDAMLFSMSTPLLRDLGLNTSMRGLVSGTIGTVAGIGGTLLAGLWVSRRGIARTLLPIALIQAAALPIYALLAWAHPQSLWVIAPAVVTEHIAAGVGTAGFSVYLMRLCAGPYKASNFAVATALMSLATTISGSASGFLAHRLGYTSFFSVACLAALPGVLLSWKVSRQLESRPLGA